MATVLTNNGEEWAAERLAGTQGSGANNVAANAGTHIGSGTGTATAAKGDTALGTEVGTRAATTVTVAGGTGASAKYQATATWAFDATRAITEMGLFSASSAGVLFVRADFAAINGGSGDSIAYTLTIDPS